MNQKIPIYRAKKIYSDEYVIFNSFYEYENKYYAINKIINQTIDGWFTNVMIPLTYKIDPTTLSIHFSDMIDSQGNKIFASLQEDGKGGDIGYVRDFSYGDLQGVAMYKDNCFKIHRKGKAMGISLSCTDIKIIGIQQ